MSVKMALAKLSATAAGGALLAGGAVHVAETPITDSPVYKSSTKTKGSVKAQPVRYIKERPRAKRRVTKSVPRKRRIVKRVVECEPMGPGMVHNGGAHHGGVQNGAARVIEGSEQCGPAYRMALAAVPAPYAPPPQPPFQGGGGGGVTVIGGGGGFGGGFGGGGGGSW